MSKNKVNERLNSLSQQKETFAHGEKTELVSKIMHQEEEEIDMKAVAEALQEQRSEELVGLNEGHTKDTLYIENDIYEAFKALCVNRGDKKKYVNEALRDFVLKKYRELGRKSK